MAEKRLEVADLKAPGMMMEGAHTYEAACSSLSVRVSGRVGVVRISDGVAQQCCYKNQTSRPNHPPLLSGARRTDCAAAYLSQRRRHCGSACRGCHRSKCTLLASRSCTRGLYTFHRPLVASWPIHIAAACVRVCVV